MKKDKQETRIFEKIIGVFAWLSFFLALITALISVFASLSGEQNGKEIFGSKILIVTSDSMSKSELSENEEIFFNAGDLIIIKKVEDPTALKDGDVITFFSYNPDSYGKTVTHKIRRVEYAPDGSVNGFVTYGINKGANDAVIVKPETVIGKYSFKISSVGKLFSYLKTPQGYYLSILIPAVLLIIFFSISVGKALGKKELKRGEYDEEMEILKKRISVLEEKGAANAARTVPSPNPSIEASPTVIPSKALVSASKPQIRLTRKTFLKPKKKNSNIDMQSFFSEFFLKVK